MKVTSKIIEVLKDMGANEWHKGNYNRLYLNEAVDALIGLEVTCYKSGNISSARLKGESISNAEARRIIERTCKAYIDLDTMELVSVNELLISAISEKEAEIAEEAAAEEEEATEEVAADDTAEEITFARAKGDFDWKSDFQCSNGKYIKFLGHGRKNRYQVGDMTFDCIARAKNFCRGLPLDYGRRKIDPSVFEGARDKSVAE